MNQTLFSAVQRLFERTYAAVGIDLEECLIDRSRCSQLTRLAGASARELRTRLRTATPSIELNPHTGSVSPSQGVPAQPNAAGQAGTIV